MFGKFELSSITRVDDKLRMREKKIVQLIARVNGGSKKSSPVSFDLPYCILTTKKQPQRRLPRGLGEGENRRGSTVSSLARSWEKERNC